MILSDRFRFEGAIDSHCHFGGWPRQEVFNRMIDPFAGRGLSSSKDVERYCAKKRLEMIVLVPIYESNLERSFSRNGDILKCANELPNIVVPGFWVDPVPESRKLLEEALSIASNGGIRVLKISPSNWSGTYSADPDTWDGELFEGIELIAHYSRKNRCVVQVHTGGNKSDIRAVERLLFFLKGITFHLVHMGGRIKSYFYFVPRFAEWLSAGIDLYCDSSLASDFAVHWMISEGTLHPEILSRLLFASDDPWGTHETEATKLAMAANGDAVLLKKLLHDNAFGVYADKRIRS